MGKKRSRGTLFRVGWICIRICNGDGYWPNDEGKDPKLEERNRTDQPWLVDKPSTVQNITDNSTRMGARRLQWLGFRGHRRQHVRLDSHPHFWRRRSVASTLENKTSLDAEGARLFDGQQQFVVEHVDAFVGRQVESVEARVRPKPIIDKT